MIRVGTSGWQYPDFKERFYPGDLPSASQLPYYSRQLAAVEVNSTFYHFSRASTYAKWRDSTAEGFQVAVKANRSFTHLHRLADPEGRLEEFLGNARELGTKLGPVLFQIPASLHRDDLRLRGFLERLPSAPGLRYAFELRHPSWDDRAVYRLLEKRGAALCIHDIRGRQSPLEVTASFAYVRLHGPLPLPYRGSYSADALSAWSERLRDLDRAGVDSYLFFDNTMTGDAIDNARDLAQRVSAPPSARIA